MPPPLPREVVREPSDPPKWEIVEQAEHGSPHRTASASEPTPVAEAISERAPLNWEVVDPTVAEGQALPEKDQALIATSPTWEVIQPGEELSAADLAREIEAREAAYLAAQKEVVSQVRPKHSAPTISGYQDLFPVKRWHPSVTTIVPMGLGSSGWIAGIGYSGQDCQPEASSCIHEYTLSPNSQNDDVTSSKFLAQGTSTHHAGELTLQTLSSIPPSTIPGTLIAETQSSSPASSYSETNAALNRRADGDPTCSSQECFKQFDRSWMFKSTITIIPHRASLLPKPPPWNDRQIYDISDHHLSSRLNNNVLQHFDQARQAVTAKNTNSNCWHITCTSENIKETRIQETRGGATSLSRAIVALTGQVDPTIGWTGRDSAKSLSVQPTQTASHISLITTPEIGGSTRNNIHEKNHPKSPQTCVSCSFRYPTKSRSLFYWPMITLRF